MRLWTDKDRHFGEAAMSNLYNYTVTFALQLRKNNSDGSRKVPIGRALGMIGCADLATVLQVASTGLLTPVTLSLRFRRSGLALDQRKYLPS